MSVTKRISGEYNIVNKGAGLDAGNVTITTNTLYVDGNLTVGGNATSVSQTNMRVTDNIITLNAGETGAGVTAIYSGIEIDRGTLANVQIRWNETADKWELSTNGTTYTYIATSSTGTTLGNVWGDPAPAISANLDLRSRTIFDSTTGISSNIKLSTAGGGATGVYVSSGSITNQELINKTKALIYIVAL